MPAGEIRLIRRRIRSVQSTMKITRAMELIAASRIVKAEARVAASRPYAVRMAHVMGNLASSAGGSVQHPLLTPREDVKHSAVLVICADRGLCGAYNTNILKLGLQALLEMPGSDKRVVAVGRKAQSYYRYRGIPVDQVWQGMSDQPRYADAREVAEYCIRRFLDGEFDRVDLVCTDFVSGVVQNPIRMPLLPIDTGLLSSVSDKIGMASGDTDVPQHHGPPPDTIFEPDPAAILGDLLPKGVESKVYSAMLDASASEHAARRRAMKAATDNARDLIRSLQLAGNKARQASITTEILEVVGGAEALSSER